MPTRMLDGEIARSESLSKVSRDAAFTFVLLVSVVDDHGRFDARPRAVLAAVYGMRDDVQVAALEGWLGELERENLIRRYFVEGRPYLFLPTWFDYQRRRESPSKWPAPPQDSEFPRNQPQEADAVAVPAAGTVTEADSCGSRAYAPGAGLTPGAADADDQEPADAGADGSLARKPDRRRAKSRSDPRPGPPGDLSPPAKSQAADGRAVLESMAKAAGITAEYLGLPPLDCRWTLPRQKLITAANRDYPEHGHELGVEILAGFRELAFGWSPEARLTAWSVEALFAPVNVGKRLQARARAAPSTRHEPEPKPLGSFDFDAPIGARA